MYTSNDQLIARIGALNEAINTALENGPDVSDIPDESFTAGELETLIESNLALLYAVRARQTMLGRIADAVRNRVRADNQTSDALEACLKIRSSGPYPLKDE